MCRVTSCTALGDVTTADKLPLADAVYSMHSAPLLWCAVARISIKAVPAAAAGVRLRPSPHHFRRKNATNLLCNSSALLVIRGMQPMATLEALMLG